MSKSLMTWLGMLTAFGVAAGASAQAYGTNDQVLTVGAGAFRSKRFEAGRLLSDGYTYGAGQYFAALPLPEGAEIRQLCLFANDHTPGQAVTVYLTAVKLVPGAGGGPEVVTIPNTMLSSTSDIGYGYYCTDFFSYTIRSHVDLDADGVADAVVYVMSADLGSEVGLGGVRVTWRRQLSPPPSMPSFGDVPASDGGFAFIEALSASGITAGCGGGNYCPGSALTRRQMAVYLSKALGLHWAD